MSVDCEHMSVDYEHIDLSHHQFIILYIYILECIIYNYFKERIYYTATPMCNLLWSFVWQTIITAAQLGWPEISCHRMLLYEFDYY